MHGIYLYLFHRHVMMLVSQYCNICVASAVKRSSFGFSNVMHRFINGINGHLPWGKIKWKSYYRSKSKPEGIPTTGQCKMNFWLQMREIVIRRSKTIVGQDQLKAALLLDELVEQYPIIKNFRSFQEHIFRISSGTLNKLVRSKFEQWLPLPTRYSITRDNMRGLKRKRLKT